MAATVSVYNHTVDLILGQELDLSNLRLMLLDNSAAFNAAHTNIDQVAGGGGSPSNDFEIFGNGWAEGGEVIANVSVIIQATNDAIMNADDVEVIASGGNIGPAYAAVIYDGTSLKPLNYIDFGQSWTAGDGTAFKGNLASGLFSGTYDG